MAFYSKPLSSFILNLLVIAVLLLLSSLSSANVLPTYSTVSPKTICLSTPYPSFCKSMLSNNTNYPANVYDYGRDSVRKSLSSSLKFSSLINKYLAHHSSLPITTIRALRDCQMLASFNTRLLMTSSKTINNTSSTLPSLKADAVQTLLSAILTNTQTCFTGLNDADAAWSVDNGLDALLANHTKLFSVALAIFTKGWVPKRKLLAGTWKPNKNQLGFRKSRLPLKMSSWNKAIYESVSGRKLAESSNTSSTDGTVLVSDIVIVNKNGSGDFTTISDAVATAPNNTDGTNGYFLIYVTAGVYEEYLYITYNKKYLMMIGDGINQTIITGNHSYVDGWTTWSSATFAVDAPGFVAVNMTFQNTAGAVKQQAVAIRNVADLSAFYSCSFEGYQDTLLAHAFRQFYTDCDIYGTVDFIFGNAAVVFQNCNIYPRLPMKGQFNTITAQGRSDPNQNTGTSIQNCTIKAAHDLASSNTTVQTYLGRPWQQYSTTVYMQSFMDSLINPSGWHVWSGDFALNTSYYAEFNNTGPGSNTSNRVTWQGYHIINATDAANFTASNFLLGDNWIPQTGVPYIGGFT